MKNFKYAGNNSNAVEFGRITLYFSYETLIAIFIDNGQFKYISENIWSSTTGKHLNAIDRGNKKARMNHNEFLKQVEYIREQFGL